jgi:MATE family multidrug resistance protein
MAVASARASYWLGAGEPQRARAAVATGFRLTALMGIALATAILLAKDGVAHVYTTHASVATLAGGVLVWVAGYHMADALQTLCVFVLRSYRITIAPLVVYCTLLWGAGLGGGYMLAYRGVGPWAAAAPSPTPFWVASTVALAATAALFMVMLWRALRSAAQARAVAPRGS